MSRWVDVNISRNDSIPARGGVYVIYINDRIAYIGQTGNLRARIRSHQFRPTYGNSMHTPWGYFDVVYGKIKISKRFGDWAMDELRLIRRLQPPINCVGSIRKKGFNHGLD